MMPRAAAAALLLSAACHAVGTATDVADGQLQNITLYHVNELSAARQGIANMNSADVLGDLSFITRGKIEPLECATASLRKQWWYDCQNSELTGAQLVVTKIRAEIDASRVGGYANCMFNDTTKAYTCACNGCPAGGVGLKNLTQLGNTSHMQPGTSSPDFIWWRTNSELKFKGLWWSTLASGECKAGERPGSSNASCGWRVVEVVKRVHKACSDAAVDRFVQHAGEACFDSCPKPLNTSSSCWVTCYYNTLLGAGAAHSYNVTGLAAGAVARAWQQPFLSEDAAQGGCPHVPLPPPL